MSEIIGNRYQVTKLIGKGGMAEVFLAWDSILNREVAIKVLKSDMSDDEVALERFKREAGATTQLSHPNIVDVYDVGDDGDKHYIVMEFVKGYTLKQLIKKRGAIPYKEAVWMIKQLAGALMEAHRKGIIHRDVKSQNVLIKPDGTIKLSDFGIALANGSMQITSKDSVLGSVHYLAPELTKGKLASMQSDIYSLGIVFYELLTGDVPFKAETPVQVALKHVKSNIPYVRDFNPEIPQAVENIVIKATAKSLSNRYKNIAVMLKDLNECLKSDHKFDPRITFGNEKDSKPDSILIADEPRNIKKKRKLPKFIIPVMCIVLIGAISAILVLSGVISPKPKQVEVPNIVNITVIEAKDKLVDYNLLIDDTRITYELSDHIEKDKIISVVPNVGENVELNTKLKIVVSSGIYSELKNYVGMDYKEAETDLKSKNFHVKLVSTNDDKMPSGKVVSQSLDPGYKYNESINNEITLTYALSDSIIIDPSIKGNSLDYAINYFNENNIPYDLHQQDKSYFTEQELNECKSNTVVRTDPEIGTNFDQNVKDKVIIYYYIEESE